jgi:hypothetical protein
LVLECIHDLQGIGALLERRLVEDGGGAVEEHGHEGGQATAQTVAGEADHRTGIGIHDIQVELGGIRDLRGEEGPRTGGDVGQHPVLGLVHHVALEGGAGVGDDDFAGSGVAVGAGGEA